MTPIRQVCILVGGKGSRLGHLTDGIAKPLLEISAGVAFLDLLIDETVRQGFDDVVLLAGYRAALVQQRYDKRRLPRGRIRVMVEAEPRGTAGALFSVRDILARRFLVLNGDSYFDTNLRALAAEALEVKGDAFLALRAVDDATGYGTVELNGNRIASFQEKSDTEPSRRLISAGAYILASSVIDRVPGLPCSLETDIFPQLVRDGRLHGSLRAGYFIDIGTSRSLERARRELPSQMRRPAAFLYDDVLTNIDLAGTAPLCQIQWARAATRPVRILNDIGYRVLLIVRKGSEQSCHAAKRIRDRLAGAGAFIDRFLPLEYSRSRRKWQPEYENINPELATIRRAISQLNIDGSRSVLIGDKCADIEVARRARINGFFHGEHNLAKSLSSFLSKTKHRQSSSQAVHYEP